MNRNAERFATYVKARENHPPPRLHKYTSLATAKKIIESEAVRFSSPVNFNDPLDTQWNMLWQLGTPEFNRAFVEKILADDFDLARVRIEELRACILEDRNKYSAMSPLQGQRYIKRLTEELDRDIVMPPRVSDQLNRLRVFCLASRPDSVQMWSYYAERHTGVVLTFDSAALESAWSLPIDEVGYSEELPEVLDPNKYPDDYLNWLAYGEDMPEMDHSRASHLWTFTKAMGWSHEHEWRYVFIADRGDAALEMSIEFPIQALVGIACGCKGDKEQFDLLAGSLLAKNPRAHVLLADRHSSVFALVAKPIDTSRWLR